MTAKLSKKQIGILWMALPFLAFMILFFLILLSGGFLSFLIEPGDVGSGVFHGLGFALGLAGIISIVAMLIGIPVGLYYFSRVESHEVTDLARHAAYGDLSHDQVAYIAGWSWSAFFMYWVWTLSNRGMRFWTLGFFAPVIQQYVWIKIAMHGRRMSWESARWESFKQFRSRQKILAWIAWILTVLGMLFFLFIITWIPAQFLKTSLSASQELNSISGSSALTSTTVSTRSCEGVDDLDGDGLIDKYEEELSADPELPDTDGDGFTDGEELKDGYDPGGPGEMTSTQVLLYRIEKSHAEQCLQ